MAPNFNARTITQKRIADRIRHCNKSRLRESGRISSFPSERWPSGPRSFRKTLRDGVAAQVLPPLKAIGEPVDLRRRLSPQTCDVSPPRVLPIRDASPAHPRLAKSHRNVPMRTPETPAAIEPFLPGSSAASLAENQLPRWLLRALMRRR